MKFKGITKLEEITRVIMARVKRNSGQQAARSTSNPKVEPDEKEFLDVCLSLAALSLGDSLILSDGPAFNKKMISKFRSYLKKLGYCLDSCDLNGTFGSIYMSRKEIPSDVESLFNKVCPAANNWPEKLKIDLIRFTIFLDTTFWGRKYLTGRAFTNTPIYCKLLSPTKESLEIIVKEVNAAPSCDSLRWRIS